MKFMLVLEKNKQCTYNKTSSILVASYQNMIAVRVMKAKLADGQRPLLEGLAGKQMHMSNVSKKIVTSRSAIVLDLSFTIVALAALLNFTYLLIYASGCFSVWSIYHH